MQHKNLTSQANDLVTIQLIKFYNFYFQQITYIFKKTML